MATTYTANFNTQYLLTTVANPAAGGTISPATGWYNSGLIAAVSATANSSNGYQFSGFTGALTGTTTPQNLTMNGPATVTAYFSQTVAAPTFSPAPGSYNGLHTITLSSATQNATIHYTLDGSTPSESVGITYNGAFSINSSVTVKAMAFLNGVDSSVVSAGYTIAPSDFTISVFDSMMNPVDSQHYMNVTRPNGGPVTYNFIVQVSPVNGFSGTVSFSLFNLPANTTTIGIPQGITVTGSGPAQAYLPITVMSNAALVPATITFNAFSTVNHVSIGHANNPAYLSVNSGPPPALSTTCAASPSTAAVSELVSFVAIAAGGTLPYQYSWSGVVTTTGSGFQFTPSAAGTYGAQVMVTDSSVPRQTASASCSVAVNNWTPASMVSPAPASVLTGGTATTFSWNAALGGASQYTLTLGLSPKSADLGSVNAGSALSATVQLPGGNPPMNIWATLGSLFGSQWLYRYYTYQVAANPASPGPSELVSAPPDIGSILILPRPPATCDSSLDYTICDDGTQQRYRYVLRRGQSSDLTGCSSDDSLLIVDSLSTSALSPFFSLTVHANPGVRTGAHFFTCSCVPNSFTCQGAQLNVGPTSGFVPLTVRRHTGNYRCSARRGSSEYSAGPRFPRRHDYDHRAIFRHSPGNPGSKALRSERK